MRVIIDLTDLLHFMEVNRTPMGVSRVETALVEAGLEEGAPPLFEFAAFAPGQGCFVAFPVPMLQALIRASRQGGRVDAPDWQELRQAKNAALAAAPPFAFEAGDRIVALGLTGANPQQLRRLRELRQQGVVVCALIHDTIPLAVPEHCEASLTHSFAEHFLAMCLQIDRAIATSDCCAQDFRLWQRRFLPALDIPVGTMPMNARLPASPASEAPELPAALRDGRPFVLCVSTIEARKNHLLLLHAWLTLLRRHGHAVIPDLVLLGRPGFNAKPVLELIQAAPELRARVTHIEHAGDGLLALLYERSLFTVFNSFYEGWGLPVTEALSHGKLVLAPDHTSLRQAGGAAALYFTPQSEPELAELAWGLIRDPDRRRRLEAAIPERMALRRWRDVAEGLVTMLQAPAPPLPEPLARLYFPIGERIGFEQPLVPDLPELPAPFTLLHQLLCEGEGWGEQERWGIWAMSGPARLRLPFPAPPHGRLILMLEVSGPPGHASTVRLRPIRPGEPPDPWVETALGAGEARLLRLVVPPCEPGDLLIEMDTSQAVQPPGEGRALTLLLTGMMICAEAQEAVQLRYLSARLGLDAPVSVSADPA
ncbi:MAG: glycosyltransferase family 1 protein [Rubritepida sp.]|nr:glycosyltransferase family 1 protein [Rubritepida sp.]